MLEYWYWYYLWGYIKQLEKGGIWVCLFYSRKKWIRNGVPHWNGDLWPWHCCLDTPRPDGRSHKLRGRYFCVSVSTTEAVGYLKTHEILGIFLHAPAGLEKRLRGNFRHEILRECRYSISLVERKSSKILKCTYILTCGYSHEVIVFHKQNSREWLLQESW